MTSRPGQRIGDERPVPIEVFDGRSVDVTDRAEDGDDRFEIDIAARRIALGLSSRSIWVQPLHLLANRCEFLS